MEGRFPEQPFDQVGSCAAADDKHIGVPTVGVDQQSVLGRLVAFIGFHLVAVCRAIRCRMSQSIQGL